MTLESMLESKWMCVKQTNNIQGTVSEVQLISWCDVNICSGMRRRLYRKVYIHPYRLQYTARKKYRFYLPNRCDIVACVFVRFFLLARITDNSHMLCLRAYNLSDSRLFAFITVLIQINNCLLITWFTITSIAERIVGRWDRLIRFARHCFDETRRRRALASNSRNLWSTLLFVQIIKNYNYCSSWSFSMFLNVPVYWCCYLAWLSFQSCWLLQYSS